MVKLLLENSADVNERSSGSYGTPFQATLLRETVDLHIIEAWGIQPQLEELTVGLQS